MALAVLLWSFLDAAIGCLCMISDPTRREYTIMALSIKDRLVSNFICCTTFPRRAPYGLCCIFVAAIAAAAAVVFDVIVSPQDDRQPGYPRIATEV